MQQSGQQPLRPVPVQGSSELQQLLDLVRLNNMHHGRSAFNSVPGNQAQFLPDFSLYNAAQLSGLLNNQGQQQTTPNEQLAQLHQWQNLQSQQNQANAAALFGSTQPALPESSTSRSSLPRGASKGDKNTNAYATRHQAAEQRRRTRINDRLERLREVVPHSERANTATFLEEVIKYVEALKERVTMLEAAQNLPLTCSQPPPSRHEALSPGGNNCDVCSTGVVAPGLEVLDHQKPAASSGQNQAGLPQSGLTTGLTSSVADVLNFTSSGQAQKETPDTPPQGPAKEEPEGAAPQLSATSLPAIPTIGAGVAGKVKEEDPEGVAKKAKLIHPTGA